MMGYRFELAGPLGMNVTSTSRAKCVEAAVRHHSVQQQIANLKAIKP